MLVARGCVAAARRALATSAGDDSVRREVSRKQRLVQVAVAVNVALLAVGLPLGWNTVVASKWREWRDRRRVVLDARLVRTHELAAQVRRRGLCVCDAELGVHRHSGLGRLAPPRPAPPRRCW